MDNSITIARAHLHEGASYAEKVTHFLKALTAPPPPGALVDSDDMEDYKSFQDFCGRLGRGFAQRLCIGTDLEHLFVGTSEDEGAALTKVVDDTVGKFESAIPGINAQINELRASAALFEDLRTQVDHILDDEWKADTRELPQATTLLKQKVPELIHAIDTPSGAVERLAKIVDYVEPKTVLTPDELLQVLNVLQSVRNADVERAMNRLLASSVASFKLADAQVHARAYSAAERFMRDHPETWPEAFKKIMHLSLSAAKGPDSPLVTM